jgi:acetate kinase
MAILAVNAGSSTLKFSIHALRDGQVTARVLSGIIQGLEPGGTLELKWRVGARESSLPLQPDGAEPFAYGLRKLGELLAREPATATLEMIAHRVVHGGGRYSASVRVTDEIIATLAQLNQLAPLHQRHNVQGIRAFRAAFPDIPQVACFDTAFHATLPELEYSFALPQAQTAQGVRRYGFHGLSYQFIMGVLRVRSRRALGRVLMAHLGNGASLCAAQGGRSCATTMGFSPLDGLMMGTRCGAIDAGVLLYLLEQGWSHDQLQSLLYTQSGLLGVSGISADMRRLRSDGSAQARRAIDLFTHRIVREAGSMVACLGGLEVLAFSGGIGEHDAELRAQVVAQLAWLGVAIDPVLNQQAVGDEVHAIHQPDSRIEVWVIPTDEGSVAAAEAARLM